MHKLTHRLLVLGIFLNQSSVSYSISLIICLLVFADSTQATITVNPWTAAYKGIDYATGTSDAAEVRIQKVFAMRVDLSEPTIEFYTTPFTPNGLYETVGQRTTDFIQTSGVVVAVNANFFSPVTTITNDPRLLSGLAVSQGNLVSPFENGYGSMLITRNNQVSFTDSIPSDMSSVWTSVSGLQTAGTCLVLQNGLPLQQSCNTSFCSANPRTAIGVSKDGRYLYLMVIDGRQSTWSMGATLYETGQWLARFGGWNGMNLDGGGSSAMARLTNGTALLLNKPSDGVQRFVGNNFGVHAQPLQPLVWNGGGTNNNWNNPTNWNGILPTPYSACDLQFAGTTRLRPYNNLAPACLIRHITFNTNAGGFVLSGGSITLNGNITNYSVNPQGISVQLITTNTNSIYAISGDVLIENSVSGTGGFNIFGPGTVRFTGTSTFTGPTKVLSGTLRVDGTVGTGDILVQSGGTLLGVGTIGGAVNLQSGATLSEGNTFSILSLNNTLTLSNGSTTIMKLAANPPTCDLIQGITTANYGGTLLVTNTSGTLKVGQTFQLFSSATQTGNFTNLISSLGTGLKGQFNPTNGVLSIVPNIPTSPTNLSFSTSGTTLTLRWPGTYLGWYAQSNAIGLGTGNYWYDIPGSIATTSLSFSIDPALTNVFFRLRYPLP